VEEGVPYASIAPPPLLQDNAECVHMLQGRLFPLLTEICLLDHAALHKDGADPALAGMVMFRSYHPYVP